MKNLKVSMKLVVSFSIVVLLATIVGIIGMIGMNSINNADDDLYNKNVVAISAIGVLRESFQDQRVQLRNMIIHSGNNDNVQEYYNAIVVIDRDMQAYFTKYDGTITDSSKEEAYYNARRLYENEFGGIKNQLLEASLISLERAIEVLYSPKVVEITNEVVQGFDQAMIQNDQWAKEAVDNNTTLFKTMFIIEIIVLLIAVFVSLFFAFYISGLISKPLAVISNFMKQAGTSGDLELKPETLEQMNKFSQIKDEIGELNHSATSFVMHIIKVSKALELVADGDLRTELAYLSEKDTLGGALSRMIENLNTMFNEINASTVQVSTSAEQVSDTATSIASSATQMASGAQSLAEGSSRQTEYMEDLSASISGVAEKTKENANMTEQAAELGDAIINKAEKGSRQMEEMIKAVGDITEASKSINNIIETIDNIALQTNLLALNAAIEAAHAGEQGKGFAVVAEEVRKLAAESAEAVQETSTLIQNSMQKAEMGAQVANEMSVSLKEIVEGINDSSGLITEIAKASEEQSRTIEEINVNIGHVVSIVQQNSALAEESAAIAEESAAAAQESSAAAQEMNSQSDLLKDLISHFKLKH